MVGDLDCRLIHKIAPRPFDASGKLIDTEYQYQCAIMPNLNISAAQACSIQQSQDHWLWYRSAWCWIWKSALKSWNNNLIWFWISIFEDDLCWKCCSAKKKTPGSCLLRLRMNDTIESQGLHLLLETWRKAVMMFDDIVWMDGDELMRFRLGGKMERGVSLCWARTPPLDRASGSD